MTETIRVAKQGGYSILTFDRGVANPMNLQMLEEIIASIKQLSVDDSVKGLIINGKENFFTAGLDIPEIVSYDKEKTRYFWKCFLDMMGEIVAFPKPVISAITGHSPAGGCIVAISSDYRIMAEGNYKIGLNEVAVGIIVPETVYQLYASWIGNRKAYQYLMEGKLMNPSEALEIGLVDRLIAPELVLEAAEAKMKQYLAFDQDTWKKSKYALRKEYISACVNYDEKILDKMIEHWYLPKTQAVLNGFVARLKKK